MSVLCSATPANTYGGIRVLALALCKVFQTLGLAAHDTFELNEWSAIALEALRVFGDTTCFVHLFAGSAKLVLTEVILTQVLRAPIAFNLCW